MRCRRSGVRFRRRCHEAWFDRLCLYCVQFGSSRCHAWFYRSHCSFRLRSGWASLLNGDCLLDGGFTGGYVQFSNLYAFFLRHLRRRCEYLRDVRLIDIGRVDVGRVELVVLTLVVLMVVLLIVVSLMTV